MKDFVIMLQILPTIQAVVKTVEALATQRGGMTGEQKKQSALAILGNVWGGLVKFGGIKEIEGVPFEGVKPIIEFLIDMSVSAFNIFGVFTKK